MQESAGRRRRTRPAEASTSSSGAIAREVEASASPVSACGPGSRSNLAFASGRLRFWGSGAYFATGRRGSAARIARRRGPWPGGAFAPP